VPRFDDGEKEKRVTQLCRTPSNLRLEVSILAIAVVSIIGTSNVHMSQA
jgi:hypothetical protein